MLSLDARILLLINRGSANPLFDLLMPLFSLQGYLLVVPFIIYMLYQGCYAKNGDGRRYLTHAIAALAAACVAAVVAEWVEFWMKPAVGRLRPCRTLEDVRLLFACPKSFSMPSGHAISSFAFAVPLFYMTRNFLSAGWRIYPLALASLIAFSRIYLGVHYPSDVLVGGFLGSFIGLATAALAERTGLRRKRTG